MNISYSFTAPESLLIVAMTAFILLLAVWLVMLIIDIWRQMRNMRRQKKRGMNTINSFSAKKR